MYYPLVPQGGATIIHSFGDLTVMSPLCWIWATTGETINLIACYKNVFLITIPLGSNSRQWTYTLKRLGATSLNNIRKLESNILMYCMVLFVTHFLLSSVASQSIHQGQAFHCRHHLKYRDGLYCRIRPCLSVSQPWAIELVRKVKLIQFNISI